MTPEHAGRVLYALRLRLQSYAPETMHFAAVGDNGTTLDLHANVCTQEILGLVERLDAALHGFTRVQCHDPVTGIVLSRVVAPLPPPGRRSR